MNVKVGDVYTYVLKRGIGDIVRACKRPFIIVEVNDDDVVGIPLTTRLNNFTDSRRVYSSLTVKGITKEICILADVPVKIARKELISKIAVVEGTLLAQIQDKVNGSIVFSDITGANDGMINKLHSEINVENESELLLFLEANIADEERKIAKLATDSNYIIDSNSVILDRIDARLSIPIELNGVIYGELLISFVNNHGEEKSIKKIPHKDKLELLCVNFDEIQETFTIEPLQVALFNEKKVSIHILSMLKGEADKIRVVQYTLFWER